MALLTIILMVTAVTAVTWLILYVIQQVEEDGYGRPGSRLPRSHEPDPFDPRRRAA